MAFRQLSLVRRRAVRRPAQSICDSRAVAVFFSDAQQTYDGSHAIENESFGMESNARMFHRQHILPNSGFRIWQSLLSADHSLLKDAHSHRFYENSVLTPSLQMHLYVRSASTAASAAQYDEHDDHGHQKESSKLKKQETSPEECDQAVIGLSSAKAKAKKGLEMQKKGVGVLKKVWSLLLQIGPFVRSVASMSREDWANKLGHLKEEMRDTLKHYWLGTKLLWADIRILSRLLLKLASGKRLSRREREQLTRTTADIFRLVPFAVFVIVPFMEFLLPVFLKVFPNMLPSTFQDKMKEQTKDKIFEADKYVQNTDEAYRKIKLALEKTQSKQKKAADPHRRELVFSLGDWVLLRFEKARLRKMKGKERLFSKLGMRYYGPFQVCDKINDVAYKLKLPEGWKIHNAFHVSLLRPFVGDVLEDIVPEEEPEVEELDEIIVPE
ncbi:hypothetical protein L7F22_004034 [Adiantum nelumboides]|nr:hypothetical protein [Adiantum nelumboides]